MNKISVIEKIEFVKSKITELYIVDVLDKIKDYVESQEVFDYQKIIQFISEQRPRKQGGIYVFIDKALGFLREELRNENKITKHQ